MPKIYEYLGILIFFYSNEHEPIHVHANKGEFESKAEFVIENGEVTEIRIKTVSGMAPLPKSEMKKFKDFLKVYTNDIVKKWIDYFILHKDVPFERITKKIK